MGWHAVSSLVYPHTHPCQGVLQHAFRLAPVCRGICCAIQQLPQCRAWAPIKPCLALLGCCSSRPSNLHGTPNRQCPLLLCVQALRNPQHDAGHADAWCCGAILYMLLGGAFPFLTMAEAARGPMRQLHYLVQRIVSGRFLPLARSVSNSGVGFVLHSLVQRVASSVAAS